MVPTREKELTKMLNTKKVYATFISGYYHTYEQSEEAAKEYCEGKGADFNGSWIPCTYNVFNPGELEVLEGEAVVNYQGTNESLCLFSEVAWAF